MRLRTSVLSSPLYPTPILTAARDDLSVCLCVTCCLTFSTVMVKATIQKKKRTCMACEDLQDVFICILQGSTFASR